MERNSSAKDYFTTTSSQFKDRIHLERPFGNHLPNPRSQSLLIFFITGNPALIEYYTPFLKYLHSLLSSSIQSYEIHIHAQSLPGFEIAADSDPYRNLNFKRPNGLLDQIQASFSALEAAILCCSESPPNANTGEVEEPTIVLIGHSVGAYIALELLHGQRFDTSPSAQGRPIPIKPNIAAVICLFPTIVHIAKSRSGQIFTPLSRIPYLPEIAANGAKILTTLLPENWLFGLMKSVTGMPPRAAAVTTAFLKSAMGVRAAITMARDEMKMITADKWDEEIWDAAKKEEKGERRHKLFFYFGDDDHWVADRTRDDLIAARGKNGDGENDDWAPVMEIDGFETPHGFCVREEHWRVVGEKVTEYVGEVLRLEEISLRAS